jgi:ATP/maltotriose-dependent transcriptional regulator MalT
VPLAVWAGPVPAEAGLERVAALHARAGGDAKLTASALVSEGAFAAGGGRFDEARSLVGRAKAILDEAMLAQWLAGPVAQLAGSIELLAGDAQAAERELRRGYDTLTEIGELSWLSTTAALLAEAVYQQGRHDEALALAQASEERAGAEDAYSHALIRSVRAKVAASAPLAEEAVALADRTDFLNLRWQVRMSAAEVLTGARRRAVVEEAVRLAEEKGFPVAAEQARGLLD